MTFEEAKMKREEMETRHQPDYDRIKEYDKYRNGIGLIPDHIRTTEEYQAVKKACDRNFAELRSFNGWFVKTFKKEIQAERNKKYSRKG